MSDAKSLDVPFFNITDSAVLKSESIENVFEAGVNGKAEDNHIAFAVPSEP